MLSSAIFECLYWAGNCSLGSDYGCLAELCVAFASTVLPEPPQLSLAGLEHETAGQHIAWHWTNTHLSSPARHNHTANATLTRCRDHDHSRSMPKSHGVLQERHRNCI